MRSNKKGQLSFNMWGGLLSLAIVMALFGLILTITSDVQEDIRDDQVDNSANCGRNSTGGTGGTISYSACGGAYEIGNESLNAQLELAQKQNTLVTAGIGIFILSLLIGGFALYRMF